MKHALVTGGAGFIGSHLVEALLARDYRVTAIDDESTGNAENLAAIRGHFNFSYVQGSAADKSLVRRLLVDVDEVYHLAAAVGTNLIATAPVHTIETTLYPAELLLSELARQAKRGPQAKCFLASSSSVYGKNPKPIWSEDDDLVLGPPAGGRWSEGAAKALAEYLALAYWREHKLPIVIGRLFNVVGPRQSGLYGAVLPRFVDAALTGRPLVIHEDGQQLRAFMHVSDAVAAIIALMQPSVAVGGVFNIGGHEPVTIHELAESVIAASQAGLEIQYQAYSDTYDASFESVPARVPNLARLAGTIDFRPSYDVESIVRELIGLARSRLRLRG